MKTAGWLLSCLCLSVAGARGADVEVVRAGAEKSSLDLSRLRAEGDSGALFMRTLEHNLQRSGLFEIRRDGGSALAVEGTYRDADGVEVRAAVRHVASGRIYVTRSYRAAAGDARSPAHRLADDIVEAVTGSVGIASTRIALIGSLRGAKNLYLCDADGGRFVQVTRENSVALAPAWFPDGQRLLYTSFHRGYPDIYTIDLRRNRRERIAGFPGLNVSGAVSPDGREIALILSKDGNPDLYVMDADSRRTRRLTRTPNAVEASPAWSPDGRRIVFVSDRAGRPHLYVTNARDGSDTRRLTLQGTENVAPDWGPRGQIAYSSRRGGRYRLFTMDPDTREKRAVTPDNADFEEPSWAPNGRHIACVRRTGYRSEIFIVDTEGDPPLRLLTVREGDWYSPVWSPKQKK